MLLGLVIVGGVLALLGIVFGSLFFVVRSSMARHRREVEAEGVLLDSGPGWITTRLHDYRAPGRYAGSRVAKNPGQLVLTRQSLFVLGLGKQRIERAELGRFTVAVDQGALRLRTENPPGATGTVEMRVAVLDAEAWVKALREAGALVA
jgi:hypothetical protein